MQKTLNDDRAAAGCGGSCVASYAAPAWTPFDTITLELDICSLAAADCSEHRGRQLSGAIGIP